MGRPAKDLTGVTIGFLVVVNCVGSSKVYGKQQPVWCCECVCGNTRVLSSGQIRQRSITSCGCKSLDLRRQREIDKTVGKVFGKLTVVEYSKTVRGQAYWVCECECGNVVEKQRQYLYKGSNPNCGCLNIQSGKQPADEIGNTYNELTVIKRTVKRNKEWHWLCQCACGNTTEVRGSHLRNGSIKRCMECGRKEQAKAITTHGLTHTKFYKRLQVSKRERREGHLDKDWTPEMEDALRKFFPACVLCGMTEQEHLETYNTSLHIDHVRPLCKGFGLSPSNALILCAKCNRQKHSKDLSELPLEWQADLIWNVFKFKDHWDDKQGVF